MTNGTGRIPGGRVALMAGTVLAGLGLPWQVVAQEADKKALELAPVQVEGAAPQAEAPTVTISQDEIDRTAPQSLKDLFRGQTAVTVGGGNSASQKIYVHGIEQDKLHVTIDGASQPGNAWHHNGTMTLDPMFLKSAEVEAHVSPADAGPGALAGTIKMETKDAKDMLLPGQDAGGTAMVSYNTNSQTLRTTGAGYAVKDGFEVMGIATRARGENYINGEHNSEAGTADDLLSGLAKLAYEGKSGDRFELSGEMVEDEGIRRMRPNLGLMNNPLNYTLSQRQTVTLGYETTAPTDTYNPKIELYYNRSVLQRPNDTGVLPSNWTRAGVFSSEIETIGGKVQNTFAIPTGTLTAGVDARNMDMFVLRYLTTTNVDEQIRNYGTFVQARIAPVEKLTVSTGLRGDYQTYHAADEQDFDNAGLSPNLSAEYALTDRITAFGGYSYNWGGFEMPEIALYHAGNVAYADDLDPTTAHNFKSGLRYSHNGLTLEGSVFRTLVDNVHLIQVVGGNAATRQRVNGPDMSSTGFDLAARQEWSNAHVGAKYTLTNAKYDGRMAVPSDYAAVTPTGHMFSVDGAYAIEPWRLIVGGSTDIALGISDSALTTAGFDRIKGYQVFNLFTEWQPAELVENWTLRVDANNIFDEKYIDRGTYAASNAAQPVWAEGRSFLLSSVLKF